MIVLFIILTALLTAVVASFFAYVATSSGSMELTSSGLRLEWPITTAGLILGTTAWWRHHPVVGLMLIGFGAGAGLYLLIEIAQRMGASRRSGQP